MAAVAPTVVAVATAAGVLAAASRPEHRAPRHDRLPGRRSAGA
ncbi:hypothetical protein ACFWVP_25780 [Streptomyces sp. NPDC058637]